jgi:hypothetical protein
MAFSTNGVFYLPIESINVNNNTVKIDDGWASSSTSFTSGKLYWTKTNGTPWLACIRAANNGGRNIYFENNSVFNAPTDCITSDGPVTIFDKNNQFLNLKAKLSSDSSIKRLSANILQGTGAPSVPASNGSLYIRTDGDASTTLYVRANGAWEPLAAY